MISPSNFKNPVQKLVHYIKPEDGTHVWQFSRVGGVNRVNLNDGMDIMSLQHLDQKLWTALSCPVHGLEIDCKTLELIDSDHDGRIRVPEILDAVNWVTSVIKNADDLILTNNSLPLSAINEDTDEGKTLLASAKQILINLGISDHNEITVEETSDVTNIFASTKFNGDGIITEESADDASLKLLITQIIHCMGSVVDRNGNSGIASDHIHDFYNSCEEYAAWYKYAEDNASQILPFGENTGEALDAFLAVKSKIDDYFLRHRLAEFDPDSIEVLNLLKSQYEAISTKDLSACTEEIALLPIAKMDSKKNLPLNEAINPSWKKALEKFKHLIITPSSPKKTFMTSEEWEALHDRFERYKQWTCEKKGMEVENLGLTAIRQILTENRKEDLNALLEKDLAMETEANNIFSVDRLVRYYRDIYTLLKNFVNFSDFYSSDSKAIFQAGSLYIDQRCCDLCIRVDNMSKHNTMAGSSGICLVYCDCYSKSKDEKMTIVAAFTDGDFDNITVGRNALFYDRSGGDWDATIIKIIENPISIREAFWSPYKKISKFITSSVEKLAASKDKEVHTTATSGIEKTTSKVDAHITEAVKSKPDTPTVPAPAATPATPQPPPQPPQPFDIGKFVGIFAAISLALGAIGSVIVSVLSGFFKLVWWQMPLALIGIMLTISLPSMVLAYLKLRKRNLAPVLDANGWAVNARTTINIIFGRTLTHLASLPENSKLILVDPFTRKKRHAGPIILISVVVLGVALYVLWYYGILDKWGIWQFFHKH